MYYSIIMQEVSIKAVSFCLPECSSDLHLFSASFWQELLLPEITQKLCGGLLFIFGLFSIYCITSTDRYLHNVDGSNCIG